MPKIGENLVGCQCSDNKNKSGTVAFDFISDTGTVGHDDLQEDNLSFDGIP
jgi:hypothetical protein